MGLMKNSGKSKIVLRSYEAEQIIETAVCFFGWRDNEYFRLVVFICKNFHKND